MALFASGIKSLPEEVFVSLAERAVAAFRQHPLSFDEADFILREALFHYYISQEEFKTGAQYLAGVNFDSTTKTFTDDERADILVKCAGMYLSIYIKQNSSSFLSSFRCSIHSFELNELSNPNSPS